MVPLLVVSEMQQDALPVYIGIPPSYWNGLSQNVVSQLPACLLECHQPTAQERNDKCQRNFKTLWTLIARQVYFRTRRSVMKNLGTGTTPIHLLFGCLKYLIEELNLFQNKVFFSLTNSSPPKPIMSY